MNRKPIDKTKKCNRRCCNCRHYDERVKNPARRSWAEHVFLCPAAGNKEIDYWNCCKKFDWRSDREYVAVEVGAGDEAKPV